VSLERLCEHRRVWQLKPVLEPIYAVWFDAMLRELSKGARVLEVGAGPGFFAERARRTRSDLRWYSSDLLAAPWNDVVGDALQLPIHTGSVDAVVGLDFIHHLARPAVFFREASRVLHTGGRLMAVEPWLTPLSYPVYRWLHHERCRLRLDPWDAFADLPTKDAFEGDSGLVRALADRTAPAVWRDLGLSPPHVDLLNGFAYLLSLGFKSGRLLPMAATRPMIRLDAALAGWAGWLGLRARLVWKRC
jgi:SAM-dependent methyltransferase